MLLKSVIVGCLTFVICFVVMFAFIFVATGFAPENCLLATTAGDCTGIANILPYSIRLLVLLAIVVYSAVLAVKEGKNNYQDNKVKKKNDDWLANYRKEHNIVPLKTKSK